MKRIILMTIAFWCVLAAAILPYLSVGFAKYGPGSAYDNNHPRQGEDQLTGLRARALGAHKNGFETFPFFAVAVLAATQMGAAGHRLDQMAMAWVVLRVAYLGFYLAGRGAIRSLVWGLSFALAVAIMTLPAWG